MKKTINKDNAIRVKNFGATREVRNPIGQTTTPGGKRVVTKKYPQYNW